MKKIFWLGLTLLAVLALAACGGMQAKVLTGADADAVLKFAEPATDNLLAGLNAGDYAVFSRDFDEEMKKGLPESAMPQMKTQVSDKIGKYVSREVTKIEEVGAYYRITYTARFEGEEKVTMLVTFDKAAPNLVAGVFFNSPKLQGK